MNRIASGFADVLIGLFSISGGAYLYFNLTGNLEMMATWALKEWNTELAIDFGAWLMVAGAALVLIGLVRISNHEDKDKNKKEHQESE